MISHAGIAQHFADIDHPPTEEGVTLVIHKLETIIGVFIGGVTLVGSLVRSSLSLFWVANCLSRLPVASFVKLFAVNHFLLVGASVTSSTSLLALPQSGLPLVMLLR